jgi:apolipoprotein N-acyltransferase
MIRTFIPMMGTMGFVAYTQASQTWLIQPASIFGVYGLGLLMMLVNYALAQSLFVALDRRWLPTDAIAVDARRSRRWLTGVGVGLAAWIGLSLIILGAAPQDAPTVRVGLLQPGFPAPAHIDTQTPQELRVQTLLEQGREAAQQGAEVLFTPELGMAVDPQVEYSDEFKALATESGTYAFWTYGLDVDAGFRNESVLLTPSGQFQEVYGKVHPGPGEPKAIYSDHYPVYETELGRLATVICMDGLFTDATRRLANEGAQLIAIPTRETIGISEQTWTYHVFRAIETRTAVIHTDVAWYSHVIDPYGRVLLTKDVSQSTRQVLVGDVPLGSGRTVVNVLGDWLGWLSLAGFIFFMVFQSRTEKQAKKAAS